MATPAAAGPAVLTIDAAGPGGAVRIVLRSDCRHPVVRQVLTDPDRFVPPPGKQSQVEKTRSRRAVYSFPADLDGRSERLYLKLYRVRTLKDVLEELLHGKRALRSLEAALEAERRGIAAPVHYGASFRAGPARRPARSALVMLGAPRNRDVRTVLRHELPAETHAAERLCFLARVGEFVGDAHRRGLVHTDLKIRNLFVRAIEPCDLVLIDFDRARFVAPDRDRNTVGQLLDVRVLLSSLAGRVSETERRRVLAAYLRGRRLSRAGRRKLLRWCGGIGQR